MPGFNLDNYEPVEDRLKRFWERYPTGSVITSMELDHNAGWVICRAQIFRATGGEPFATGYAKSPIKGGKQAEGTHPLETAETSAIGRALANGNFASDVAPRASREEMAQVHEVPEPTHGVNALYLLDGMTDEDKATFKAAIALKFTGIALSNLHPDLLEELTLLAAECCAQVDNDQPIPGDFSEEPF